MRKMFFIAFLLLVAAGSVWANGSPEAPGPVENLRVTNGITYLPSLDRYMVEPNYFLVVDWEPPVNQGKTLSKYKIVYTYCGDNPLREVNFTYEHSRDIDNKRRVAKVTNYETGEWFLKKITVSAIASDLGVTAEGEARSINIGVDKQGPQVNGVKVSASPGNQFIFQNTSWYHGDMTVTFQASDYNHFPNNSTGINEGSWEHYYRSYRDSSLKPLSSGSGVITLNTSMFPVEYEGYYSSYVIVSRVRDLMGNISSDFSYQIHVDNAQPSSIYSTSIKLNLVTGSSRILGFNASWSPVSDNPSSNVQVFYDSSFSEAVQGSSDFPVNGVSHYHNSVYGYRSGISAFPRNKLMTFAVRPVDYFGIAGAWTQFPYPIFIPEFPAGVSQVLVQKSAVSEDEPPRFRVLTVLDKDADFLFIENNRNKPFALDMIKVFRDNVEVTSSDDRRSMDIFQGASKEVFAGDEFPESGWCLYNDGSTSKLAYAQTLVGDEFSHKGLMFFVKTGYPDYLGGAEEGNNGPPVGKMLYNYQADFDIEFVDLDSSDLKLLGKIRVSPDRSAVPEEVENTADYSVGSGSISVGSNHVGLRIRGISDPENDEIDYGIAEDLSVFSTRSGVIDLADALGSPFGDVDSLSFRLEYLEVNDSIGFAQDFKSFFTISLYINTNTPIVMNGFSAGYADGSPLPEAGGKIFSAEGNIYLKDISIQNGDLLNVYIGGELVASAPVDNSDEGVIGVVREIPVPLGDSDGEVVLSLVASNGFGNSSGPTEFRVQLDRSAPLIPSGVNGGPAFSYNHSSPGSTVEVFLPPANPDVKEYDLLFPDRSLSLSAGSFSYDVSGYAFDALIPCHIRARDFAGNESAEVTWFINTIPAAGCLKDTPFQAGTSLLWELLSPGIASSYLLEAVNGEGPVVEIPAGESQFVVTDLSPRTPYEFRFAAVNRHGFAVYETENGAPKLFSVTLGNNKPVWTDESFSFEPALYNDGSVNYLKESFLLSWVGASDADPGDALFYLVQFKPSSGTLWLNAGGWQGECFEDISGLFSGGNSYDIRVLVRDESMGVNDYVISPVTAFVVDANPPVLSASRALGPSQAVTIRASDNESGVARCFYDLSAPSGPVLSNMPVSLASENDGLSGVVDIQSESRVLGVADGIYSLYLYLEDNAGNRWQAVFGNILVDNLPPVIEEESLRLAQGCAVGLVPFSVNVSDNIYGVKELRYGFVPVDGELGAPLDEPGILAPGSGYNSDGSGSFFEVADGALFLNKEPGLYFLKLQAVDWAGNESPVFLYRQRELLFDSSPPAGELSVSGLVEQGGELFRNRNLTLDGGSGALVPLSGQCDASDPESLVASVEYGIFPESDVEPVSGWFGSLEEAEGEILYNHGDRYRAAARVINGVGGVSIIEGKRFVYDEAEIIYGIYNSSRLISSRDEVPLEALPVGIVSGQYDIVCGERISLKSAVVYDQLTPFTDFSLRIRNVLDPEDDSFMDALPQASAGVWTVRVFNRAVPLESGSVVFGGEVDFLFSVPPVGDGCWEFLLQSANALGSVGNPASEDIRFVLNTRASGSGLSVSDNGPFQSFAEGDAGVLRFSWDSPGSQVYGIQYRLRAEGDDSPGPWSAVVSGRDLSAEILNPVPGVRYFIEAAAVFSEGGAADYNTIYHSIPGVRFDSSAPVIDELFYDSACSPGNLEVFLKASDQESGCLNAEARILRAFVSGSAPEGGDFLLWEDVSGEWFELPAAGLSQGCYMSIPAAVSGGGRIAVRLRITNGAGLSETLSTALITIDDSAPQAPVVIDQGQFINSAQRPSFHWLFSPDDPESGISGFKWALVSSPAQLADCLWFFSEERVLDTNNILLPDYFSSEHGVTWYLAVKSINNAGLESPVGLSNGITYDNTAPLIPAVILEQPAGSGDRNFINSLSGLYVSINASEDLGSIVSYSATAGRVDGNLNWSPFNSDPVESSESLLALPDFSGVSPVPDEDILMIYGEAVNSSALVAGGFSKGCLFVPDGMTLSNIFAFISGNSLYVSWERSGRAPVKSFKYFLSGAAEGVPSENAEWVDNGSELSAVIDISGLAEGRYRVYVRGEDEVSQAFGVSNLLVADFSPPSVDLALSSSQVSSVLRFSISAQENQSIMEEYSWAVGTLEDPELFSGGRISFFSNSLQIVDKRIDLTLLPRSIPAGSVFFLSVSGINSRGLESVRVFSPPLLFDPSQPSTPVISLSGEDGSGGFTRNRSQIEGFSLSSMSYGSGIAGFRAGVIPVEDKDAFSASGPDVFPTVMLPEAAPDVFLEDLAAFTEAGVLMAEGGCYVVAVQVLSSAGIWSEPGFSAGVWADFTAPVFSFSDNSLLVINDYFPDGDYAVISSSFNRMFVVNDSVSSKLFADFRLEGGGNVIELADLVIFKQDFGSSINYHLNLLNMGLAFGEYKLAVTLRDLAGHSFSADLPLLVNAAPDVKLNNVVVQPHGTVFFMDEVFISDKESGVYAPDERSLQESFRYEWDFNNDGFCDLDFNPFRDSPVPWLEPQQSYDGVFKSGYPVSLRVTDFHGKSSVVSCRVFVLNTKIGSLLGDEVWNEDHGIIGDVTVPADTTLIIDSGARVLVTGNYRLIVKGSLIMREGASMKHKNDVGQYRGDWWKGILIEEGGSASVTDSLIQQAENGLTINEQPGGANTQAVIISSQFDYNQTGVHVCGDDSVISGSSFTRNNKYGIKEDSGAIPDISNCRFSENSYDYYDEDKTAVEVYNEE